MFPTVNLTLPLNIVVRMKVSFSASDSDSQVDHTAVLAQQDHGDAADDQGIPSYIWTRMGPCDTMPHVALY